jgi:transposase InsO family protein
VIRSNAHKYSISALCKCLNIARSTYYYEAKDAAQDVGLEAEIEEIFIHSRKVYGSRKIKVELQKRGKRVSRRKICRIMKKKNLESAYSKSRFKIHRGKCNDASTPNELNRHFNGQNRYGAVVSDLTYVRVNYKWNYICILVDLFNREIIGYSAGTNKDANLVYDAFATVKGNLGEVQIFHTDRGSEFNNQIIDDMLKAFQIKRSLSLKGCPYDNAVAESTFKTLKAEFVYGRNFDSIERLRLELGDYINWYNNFRIHGSLGYLSPKEYKAITL